MERKAAPQARRPATESARPGGRSDRRRARWSGVDTIDALRAAAAHFEPYVPAINALNVFPVPDGDTGTNMFLTIQAAVREAQHLDPEHLAAGDVLGRAAYGALMGARGNSGVILYQILLGIAESVEGIGLLDGQHLAAGLTRATELAYRAVVKPVEGTMLTVIRAAAEAANRAAQQDQSLAIVLAAARTGAEETLRRTPELLPILRQAGVVDAGGQGLVVLFDGLQHFAEGLAPTVSPFVANLSPTSVAASMSFLDQHEIVHDIEGYGYCTNFVVTGDDLPIVQFRQRMDELGTSAVVVGDSRAVKVHIHSDHPGLILEAALAFGELHQVRIDNMAAQTQKLISDRAAQEQVPAAGARGGVGVGLIAVASGDGLAKALRGMGATEVVPGGPTFNPSIEDILKGIRKVPYDTVIVLPNDSNVIPAARQVEKLTDKVVRVIPTTSVPQGISALSAFNFDADLDENVEAMSEAVGLVTTLSVTRATRDVELDGVVAHHGDVIGLIDGALRTSGTDVVDVTLQLLELADADQAELLTIFTGEPAGHDLASRLEDAIAEAFPNLELEVVEGGQPHYDLILSME